MAATTFDYRAALDTENHARPHSVDVNGDPAVALMGVNYAAIPGPAVRRRLEQRQRHA